jgi:hypothetical protein
MDMMTKRLPKRVQGTLPLIHERIRNALIHHSLTIDTWDIAGKPFELRAIDSASVINIIICVIQRMLVNGTLRFDGMHPDIRHCLGVSMSVAGEMHTELRGKFFLLKDVERLIAQALFQFLIKQHAIVVGDRKPLQKRPSPLLSLRRQYGTPLH